MSRATHAQNEQQLFKAAFERSLEAIVILNQEHQLVELNRAACQLLGAQRTTLLGQSIAKLLPGLAETLSTAALQSTEAVHEVHRPHADGTTQTLAYTCIANVLPHRHLVTLQDTTRLKRATGAELRRQHQRAELLSEVTLKIRQSLQLEEILQTAVTEVQRILQADRVLIYQVFANGTGMSISEAVLPTFAPILGVEFPEEVFPEEYRTLYAQGRVQAIAHVQSPDSGVAECLVDFMNEWDVQAKLIAPILQNLKPQTGQTKAKNQLWGLLIAHQCQTPRDWTEFEQALMQQLADQIAIALAQAELLENLEELVAIRTAKLRQANHNLRREIRDRQQVEAALRRSEEQLRLIANGLPVLISYVDQNQCYRFSNDAYQEWFGLSPLNMQGQHLATVHGQAEYQKIQPYVAQVLAGQAINYQVEMRLHDGCAHVLNVTYMPHTSETASELASELDYEAEQDAVKGFFVLTHDISEQKAIERLKDEFISVVSHELRTPLTSIHSSLKILSTGNVATLSAQGQRMLEIADGQTERLVRLVNNVLDFQSLQSGEVRLVKVACQASDLMQEAAQTMQAFAQEHAIQLFTESVPFVVLANHDYIVQTLTNLLSNAIKFSPANSHVWLSAKQYTESNFRQAHLHPLDSPTDIVFEVRDQGQGIPPDWLEIIFERFQQVDSSDARKKGGTGLGLTICRQIIEAHGGEIWVESVVGTGSTFYFTLPEYMPERSAVHG